MKIALLNPPWSFEGSIYFGCREPHLPLELGYCRSLLEADGHEVLLLDGAFDGLTIAGLAERVAQFAPDLAVRHHRPDLPLLALRAAGTDDPGGARGGGARPCALPGRDRAARLVDAARRAQQAAGRPRRDGRGGGGRPRDRQRRRLGDHAGHRVLARSGADHRRRPARRALRRSARPALAGALDPGPPPPSSPLREPAGRAGRRGRGLARLSLPLQLLRQAALSRPLPPAAARHRGRRDRRAGRPGRDLPLLHRRDLPAAARPARGAGRPAGEVRGPDPDRPVEAGAARAARRGRLRVDRGRRRERDRAGTGDPRQELPDEHRGARRPPDPRQAARALRAGQPARGRRRRSGPARQLARPAARRGRLGERPGAVVPLSRLARLPGALRSAGRMGMGACPSEHYLRSFDEFSDIQDERPLPLGELERACRCA